MAPKKKKKKIVKKIRLVIEAGKATPAPPIGPAVGGAGLNIMMVCKALNALTQSMQGRVPVVIIVFEDKSFETFAKQGLASDMIRAKAGLKKGAANPGREIAGTVTQEALIEIAKVKNPDMSAASTEAAARSLAGTARSMGIKVVQ